jgi:GntR family transcriptional regulator
MTAGISVDLGSPTPPYEQIRLQVSALIAAGGLSAGTRLPSVRSLAADLGLAAGTVARAYKELEQSGLIETRRRNGTVVVGLPAYRGPDTGVPGSGGAGSITAGSGAAAAELGAAVERLIVAGTTAGLPDEELLALLRVGLQRRRGLPSDPSATEFLEAP